MSGTRTRHLKGGERRKFYTRQPQGRHTCTDCGKQAYATKSQAKTVAKEVHPGEHMNVYRCGDRFHVGHLSPAIRQGHTTRLERYR